MLSEDERAAVKMGGIAKKLIEYPEWTFFEESIKMLRATYGRLAVQRGETEFEKGALFAIDLVLQSPQDTIDERKRLLDREKNQQIPDRWGGKVSNSESSLLSRRLKVYRRTMISRGRTGCLPRDLQQKSFDEHVLI